MKNMSKNWLRVSLTALTLSSATALFAASDSATTTLGVTVAAEATITVTANPTLAKGTTEFESYTGNTTFNYRVRTTQGSGVGSVTALVTTAFEGASGITTADLSHVASNSGVGTANGTSTTASTEAATSILTFGADAHSSDTNDSATINWTLVDRPAYKTGSYSTVVTLTISAT
jgi:hypothetical protein